MSATKGRKPEGTFHIQFPARRDFWTWTELGCLARALGFPTDLIRHNVTEEVETEEGGMDMQQLHRMIELKVLNQALHRSFNMHTSDWNLCVIRKAAQLLSISVLSFEELHNIRVAYATYEAGDMKGLLLDQRTLLRTLKMCHRVISPKKLMHRVKHMKRRLEEANRIQLYEFFDLILWCDYMEHCQESHKVGEAEGKEKDLYNLVDFESLLSHQDQRRSRALDKRYLAEEWNFGREQLGSKHMFKGEVVYTDQRVKQTRIQKKNYRGLKRVVSQSQRLVYRAHAGSIRQRPISAPDLSMYSTPRGTPCARTTSAAAMYQSVQRRLHSATSPRANSGLNRSDRPSLPEYVRAHTPSVVTSQDLDEASLKMEMLKFDIVTLGTRCEVKMQEEMNFYIPEYEPPAEEDTSGRTAKEGRKAEHWTPDIIDSLAYPPYHLPRHHAHTCDARFRGWKPAEQQGRQRILTKPTYDSSPKGQLLARQRSAMLAPVTDLHKDYVVRYTSRKEATEQQKARRPCTAPMASPRTKPLKRLGCRSAGACSRRLEDSTRTSFTTTATKTAGDITEEFDESRNEETTPTAMVVKSYPDPYGKYGGQEERVRNLASKEESDGAQVEDYSGYQASSPDAVKNGPAAACRQYGSSADPSSPKAGGGDADSGAGREEERSLPPVPYNNKTGPSRRPGGSKVVDMGLIGTVTLLESIQEHEIEDTLSSTSSTPSSPRHPHHPQPPATTAHPSTPGRYPETLDLSSQSIPAGWSRHPGTNATNERAGPSCSTKPWQAGVEGQTQRRTGGDAVSAAAASRVDQALKDAPLTGSDGAGQFQKPGERFLQADTVSTGGQEMRQYYDRQSSRVKGEPPLRAERRGDAEARKPRVNSAASSTVSERSDHREVPPPLTSVTVVVKNKNQHVTTSTTRVNTDVEDQFDVTEGNVPSPLLAFKRSSPCITSTPRRKRASPTTTSNNKNNTPKGRHAGLGGNPNQRKSSQASYHTNPPQANMDPVNRPDSAGKGLGRKTLSLLPSQTDPDGRLDWVQDQILAMNSASRNIPPQEEEWEEEEEEDAEKESDRSDTEGEDPPTHVEDGLFGEKKTIRFPKEQEEQPAFLGRRQEAQKQYLLRRKASEGVLKLQNYDLNAEAARRFIFNRATTRRLLQRVDDDISPELRTRIRRGDTGLKVI